MRFQKRLAVATLVFLASAPGAGVAGDFDWLRELNIRARSDLSDFRARLSARFEVGDARIRAVISSVEKPADAYMVLRLGELSGRSPRSVLERYRARPDVGWGRLAKSLGIKPGSRAFHALKRGGGLFEEKGSSAHPGRGKARGRSGGGSRGNGRPPGKPGRS